MHKSVFALDPGPEKSGWVLWNGNKLLDHDQQLNDDILEEILNGSRLDSATDYACENIHYYGGKVGRDVFDTCHWIGRFTQVLQPRPLCLITRPKVNLVVCRDRAATDKTIREALDFRFGPVGTKKAPGPLYGVTSHTWAALAVAVAYLETQDVKPPTNGRRT